MITGKLIYRVGSHAIEQIDAFEGYEYLRLTETVRVGSRNVAAFVYVNAVHPEDQLGDEWDPDTFEHAHLRDFLAAF